MKNGVVNNTLMNDHQKKIVCRILLVLLAIISVYFYVEKTIRIPLKNYHTNDFKHMYLAGKIVRYGKNPYDDKLLLKYSRMEKMQSINPFVYPVFNAFVFVPFAMTRFSTAKILWFISNHLFVLAGLVLLVRLFARHRWVIFFGLLLALAFSHPWYRTLTAGQLNGLLFFLYSAMFYAFLKDKGHLLATLIAVGGMIKVLPFFMGLLLFTKPFRKYLLTFFGVFFLLNIMCILGADLQTHLDYLPILKAMRFGSSTWAQYGATFHIDEANQSLWALLLRTFTENVYNSSPPITVSVLWIKGVFYITALMTIVFGFLGCFRFDFSDSISRMRFFIYAMMTNFMLPTICWDHYYLILLVPVIVLMLLFEKKHLIWFIPIVILIFGYFFPYNFWDPTLKDGWKYLLINPRLYFFLIFYLFMIFSILKNDFITMRKSPLPIDNKRISG